MLKTTTYGKGRLGLLLCLAGLLCLSGISAPTLRADDGSDKGDPPSRVARISYLEGSVSLQPGGSGDWGAAARNRPMTIGDKIWSDKDSRAELQTGVLTIHMGSMTAMSFLNLDENITQLRLAEGSLNFRVREMREGDVFEVDTPNLTFTVKQAGAFRIDVSEDGGNTGITVIRGAGQVTASGQSYDIPAGQRGVFNGTDNVESQILQAPGEDGLDRWANDRDLREQNSVSQRYVPQDMPGTDDLDNNGTWNEEPEYGHVWYPNEVAPDWAPYSNGYWSYVGPWGWTWVDYAPWGFAPFHYGRWAFIGGRWGWCPGPVIYPAVYGPAFVGFLGGGFGFGFGVGFGVGWFPLGWGEPFHPWFRCGRGFEERINVHNTFIRNVNIVHNNNFNNFRFAHDTRAVTATSRTGFTGGEMVRRGTFKVTEASLRGAQVSNRVGVSPTRQSAFGAANLHSGVARPSSSIENRTVFARTTPAAGASHIPVRSINTNNVRAGQFSANGGASVKGSTNGSANSGLNASRQSQLQQNRPPASNNMRTWNGSTNGGNGANGVNGQRNGNTRTWEAQGSTSDRGRAPQGFGQNGSANTSVRTNRPDRPPWAGSSPTTNENGRNNVNSGNNGRAYNNNNMRSYEPPQRNTPNYDRNPRTYSAPPSRSYSPPTRSYSPPPTRSYSPAPSRSYSAPPSRSYSAPSHPSGGGGGSSSHGGGGGGKPHR